MVKFIIRNQENKYYNQKEKSWNFDSNAATRWKTQAAATEVAKTLGDDITKYTLVAMDGMKEANTPDNLISAEEASEAYAALGDAVAALGKLEKLINYYSAEQRKYDEMEQDILHKIEFDSVVGLKGLRLIAQLKDVRLHRREAKNKVSYLITLQNCFNSNIKVASDKFYEKGENLTYVPRQLPELFK